MPAISIDVREGTVSGPGGEARLEPKVMEVLLVLARYAGHVVSRKELMDTVWPDVVVTEHTLSRCVYQLRENLREALRQGKTLFPGIIGYDETIIPELINAILSRHDFILLGLRGQAKTRILRSLVDLLDPWIPVVAGSEINDHPFHPISAPARRMVAEAGDETEIDWIPRELRYQEKLATPDGASV